MMFSQNQPNKMSISNGCIFHSCISTFKNTIHSNSKYACVGSGLFAINFNFIYTMHIFICLEHIFQLELCAFALKGEHNVYSLVPNIAVCMYIYIDTKFSYDNNVYFSIFCEHRQLKHGMHVI